MDLTARAWRAGQCCVPVPPFRTPPDAERVSLDARGSEMSGVWRWPGWRLEHAVLCAALAVALSGAARAVDVAGTQVTLAWTPATGPVAGYYVIVARNAGTAKAESLVVQPGATIKGSYGETVVVQAAAFGADSVAGPISPKSLPIRFVTSSPAPAPSSPQPPPPSPSPGPSPNPSPGGGGGGVPRDFNGDGTADLIVRSGNTLRVWAMDGSHVASVLVLPDAPAYSDLVGTGDYDGNRTSDLLWEDARSSQLVLWLLNGGVVVKTGVLDRSSLPASEEWHVGGSADFDGDGSDDVMLFSRIRGEVETWALRGTAIAKRSRISGHTGAWSVAATADTDGDGRGEFVWMDELDRTLERRKPAATTAQSLGQLAAGWRVIGAGHLDGSAAARLVVRNATTGATQAWSLDAQGRMTARALPSSLALGDFAGSGDYDGDGRDDLAWVDTARGTIRVWLSRSSGAPAAVTVDRTLAAGSALASGASGSDDSAFRDRFCTISGQELKDLQPCLRSHRKSGCEAADLDSDGEITAIDEAIWELRASGQGCD